MSSKFDSRQLGKTSLIVYLFLFIPVGYLLYQSNSDLKEFIMNPGFITSENILEDLSNLLILVCFTLLVGLVSSLAFQFYSNRNQSSIDFCDEEKPKSNSDSAVSETEPFQESPKKDSVFDRINSIEQKVSDEELLSLLCTELKAGVGAIFRAIESSEGVYLNFSAGYAYHRPKGTDQKIQFGEGLTGQVAKNQKTIIVENTSYNKLKIVSGLGAASPKSVVILPIINKGKTLAVIEIASLTTNYTLKKATFDALPVTLLSKMKF